MLFQELGKFKRSSIMTSIVLMALGIVMIICPEGYVSSLVSTLGYTMLIAATVQVLNFISGKKVLIQYIYFTLALVAGLLGAAVLVFDNDVVKVIGLSFGIGLILSGVVTLLHTLIYVRRSQRKSWWVLVVLDALTMLCGLTLLVNPWWKTPVALFDVIGLMLLFSSLVGIVRLIYIWPIKGERE